MWCSPPGPVCSSAKDLPVSGQVSLVVLGAITIPTMALWFLTEPVLQAFGQSLAHKAGIYAQILALCLPARTLFGQVSQFFSAQKIIRPSAYVSAFGAVLNLVLGLLLVLGIPVPGWNGFGYIACPSVTVASEYSQLVMFFLYACLWKRLHEECWGGCAPSHITRARVWEYIKMYTPAALSGASDWWRVSVIGVFAARLGSTEVPRLHTAHLLHLVLHPCTRTTSSCAPPMHTPQPTSVGGRVQRELPDHLDDSHGHRIIGWCAASETCDPTGRQRYHRG